MHGRTARPAYIGLREHPAVDAYPAAAADTDGPARPEAVRNARKRCGLPAEFAVDTATDAIKRVPNDGTPIKIVVAAWTVNRMSTSS
jgi:hypothetical protein